MPEQAFARSTFLSLCVYQGLLVACAAWALLTRCQIFTQAADFDEFYVILIFLQSLFGIFVLPFSLQAFKNHRTLFVDYLLLFITALPFAIAGAFATSVPWYGVVLTQMAVFGIWSVAYGTREVLVSRLNAGMLYIPLSALVFLGLPVAGAILASFTDNARVLSSFSVPGILVSWSSGTYLDANGWLGILSCLGAALIWSVKLMKARESRESLEAGESR